jgi:CO/xanthine dehydrogenase FAD-binding subunit
VATRAAESALKGATPLRQNGYKVTLAKRLVRRAILQAAGVHA